MRRGGRAPTTLQAVGQGNQAVARSNQIPRGRDQKNHGPGSHKGTTEGGGEVVTRQEKGPTKTKRKQRTKKKADLLNPNCHKETVQNITAFNVKKTYQLRAGGKMWLARNLSGTSDHPTLVTLANKGALAMPRNETYTHSSAPNHT